MVRFIELYSFIVCLQVLWLVLLQHLRFAFLFVSYSVFVTKYNTVLPLHDMPLVRIDPSRRWFIPRNGRFFFQLQNWNFRPPCLQTVMLESSFLGKTPYGVLPLCDDRRTPASLSSSSLSFVQRPKITPPTAST